MRQKCQRDNLVSDGLDDFKVERLVLGVCKSSLFHLSLL